MRVSKVLGFVPGFLHTIDLKSLTAKMVALATVAGLSVWLLLDHFYQHAADQAVSAEWTERFQLQARQERARLRNSFTSFEETAQYLAAYGPLLKQLGDWNRLNQTVTPVPSRWKPEWLSTVRSIDGRVPLDFVVVQDARRENVAIYQNGSADLSVGLRNLEPGFWRAAAEKIQLREFDHAHYLFAAAAVAGDGERVAGLVLIATRIDAALLGGILDKTSERTVSGLSMGNGEGPLAVSPAEFMDRFSSAGRFDPALFEVLSSELLLDYDSGTTLRHTLWLLKDQLGGIGGYFLYSLREQRTWTILVFAAIFSLILVWVSGRVSRIHRSLDHYAKLLGVHLPDKPKGDSIHRLDQRLRRLSEEVIAETYALEYQAQHDSLTSLPNRTLLLERLESELQDAQDEQEPLALLIMDLDRFKEVNDTLGHHVGDRLLQEVARRLTSVLRRSDTVSRLGGDEFAVLLPGADYQRSKAVCRKILAVMDKPAKVDNFCLRTGLSIGVALSPDHGLDTNLLLQHADVAMYQAKRKHSGFVVYTADRDEHSVSRLGLSAELRDAIDKDELILHYQPMVDFKTGSIFCAEALARWKHPSLGDVPPEEFVTLAEQTGVIRPLTLWVLNKALEQAAAWRKAGINLQISINLSVRSLQDRKLPGQVQKLVDKHQVDPKKVILEITESAIMSDPLVARRVMRRLSNMGFQLSIDDFGTGYSSLAYLKQLPVDEIKIDKSFVTQMDSDENDAVIVRATIDLAHNLGLKVVAEGVESTDVWDLLDMLGCDCAQGYFIRQPLAPHELASWICSKEWKQARWVVPVPVAR